MFGEGQKDVYMELHGSSDEPVRYKDRTDCVSEAIGRGIAFAGAQTARLVFAIASYFNPKYNRPASEFELAPADEESSVFEYTVEKEAAKLKGNK